MHASLTHSDKKEKHKYTENKFVSHNAKHDANIMTHNNRYKHIEKIQQAKQFYVIDSKL